MNQKKAKSIRRTMKRLFGRDPREVITQPKKAVVIRAPGLMRGVIHSAVWTGQHTRSRRPAAAPSTSA
jgi:hypothetical protein